MAETGRIASVAFSEDDYYPSLSVYNPQISVDQWREILENPELTPPAMLAMLKCILELGGEATCAQLAQNGKYSAWYYNALGMHFGRRIKKKYNLPDFKDGGVTKFFVIPFLGRYVNGGKHYAWKLRNELKEALIEMNKNRDSYLGEKQGEPVAMEKNIILYGPPGTGKTYHTCLYAVAIIEECSLETLLKENYEEVRERFNEYRQQGLIEFTTFHQSYSYEDFVEGIRPVIQDDDVNMDGVIRYRVEAGVFRQFCDKAETEKFTESLRTETSAFDELEIGSSPVIWKVSLAGSGDNPIRSECLENGHIRIGWDSYGKDVTEETDFEYGGKAILDAFINKMEVGDIVVSCYSESVTDAVGIVTGEYEWHEEFEEYMRVRKVRWLVKNIRQNIYELNNGIKMTLSTVYQLKNINLDELLAIVKRHVVGQNNVVASKKLKNRVFIIDEINRGNISGIFGELITIIEPSKRLGAKESLKVRLPYSRKEFGVPDNIYIIGTMNTADRSLTGLDIALRRRFYFKRMSPEPRLLADMKLGDSGFTVADLLSVMNKRIAALLDLDHCIGHAPFLRLTRGYVSLSELSDIFRHAIFPLLEEYFFEDWNKIRVVLNDSHKLNPVVQFVRKIENDNSTLEYEDVPSNKDFEINEKAFLIMDSYAQIINENAHCTGENIVDAGDSAPSVRERFSSPESLEELMEKKEIISQQVVYKNIVFVEIKKHYYAMYDRESGNKISNQSECCRNLIQTDPLLSNITFDEKTRTYDFIREIMKRISSVSE